MESKILKLISEISAMENSDPRVEKITRVVDGNSEAQEDKLLTLAETARLLGYHPTWLAKLRVPEACGHRIAGRRKYSKNEVMRYMQSEDCQQVLSERRMKRQKNNPNH